MKQQIRTWIAVLLIVLTIGSTTVTASAADITSAEESLVQSVTSALEVASPAQPETLADRKITNIYFLSAEQIDSISDALSEEANVYLVELQDGRKTYYMAIDLRTEGAVYYSNLFVLRRTSRKLLQRSESLAEQAEIDDAALMDYRHILGELAIHLAGYRLTDGLGGERLSGALGKVYHTCMVADLNIDEDRMPVLIRIVGLLMG